MIFFFFLACSYFPCYILLLSLLRHASILEVSLEVSQDNLMGSVIFKKLKMKVPQLEFTSSKSTRETPEKCVKTVQSSADVFLVS